MWENWWAIMRVSTKEQKFDLQQDALRAAGVLDRYCYQDVASGAKQARPGLAACLKALHPLSLPKTLQSGRDQDAFN